MTCRYLVDNKADVGSVCVNDFGRIIPVVILTLHEFERKTVEGADLVECRRILFKGGADPTVHAYKESSYIVLPVLWDALKENSVVNLIRIPLQYNYLRYAGINKNDRRLRGSLL